MGVSRVDYGSETLIDLTNDTVTSSDLIKGVTAHDAAGNSIIGTLEIAETSETITPIAGDTVVMANFGSYQAEKSSNVLATGIKMVMNKSGTYRFKTIARNSYSESSSFGYVSQVQFYKNGTAFGTPHEMAATTTTIITEDIECDANDEIEVYASSANSSYITNCYGLFACIQGLPQIINDAFLIQLIGRTQTHMDIPSNITEIGNHAFYNYKSLTSVTIPNSVTVIGTGAFQFCTGLTSIEIPNSVTSIGDYAFYNCFNLTVIDMTSFTSVPTLVGDPEDINYAFYGMKNFVIKVPSSLETEWKTAENWSDWSSYIQGV